MSDRTFTSEEKQKGGAQKHFDHPEQKKKREKVK